ncbi:MAG TPA: GNAT family N-acetyltransferase [Anaerolineales bacterium]|nr:GNAT family N-acetyltransferase [Anaerolineales bacterium]
MKYTARLYQSKGDLAEIGKLIRYAHARQNYFNAWSFCRYDIWSQRRIADTESFHDDLWQKQFQLMYDETGKLVGTTFAFNNHHWRSDPEPYALILDPEHPHLSETLVEWAESSGMCEIEIIQGNRFLTDLIQSRGYTRSSAFMVMREKLLTNTPHESVDLPKGYSICILDRSEWDCYFEAVHTVFNMMDTHEAFASIQQSPSNVHDLHLNVLNEQNQITAFCSVWLDRDNNVAEFEPVGTLPQFQKQGLGAALMAYACNRLREIGCARANVESWSESIGANKLYSACGFVEQDRLYSWRNDSRR